MFYITEIENGQYYVYEKLNNVLYQAIAQFSDFRITKFDTLQQIFEIPFVRYYIQHAPSMEGELRCVLDTFTIEEVKAKYADLLV